MSLLLTWPRAQEDSVPCFALILLPFPFFRFFWPEAPYFPFLTPILPPFPPHEARTRNSKCMLSVFSSRSLSALALFFPVKCYEVFLSFLGTTS